MLKTHHLKRTLMPGLVLVSTLLLVPGGILAQDTVDELVEKYLSASGGKDKLSQVKSRVMKGEFSIPDMGMYATLEMYFQSPDKVFTSVDLAEFGGASNGVNGDVAWDINPMTGPRILEGGEKQAAIRRSAINEFLDWKKYFPKAEVSGEEMVGDMNCIKVIFTPIEGEPVEYFFSKESGLILRVVTNEGGQFMEITFDDFREVDGIKVPFFQGMINPQFSFEIQLESIENNVDIPIEKFDIPTEIKALLK